MPFTSAQCITETDKHPDAAKLTSYDKNEYSQGYGLIEQAFEFLIKYDILRPYVSNHDIRSSNVRVDDVDYNLYVFDIQYQEFYTSAQPIKIENKTDGAALNDVSG